MTRAPTPRGDCGLRNADCGLKTSEPAACRSAGHVNPQSRCSLLRGIRIERGTRQDWLALAPLHYRSHHAGAVTDIFKAVWERGISSRSHCGLRIADCGLTDGEPGTQNSELGAPSGDAVSPLVPRSALRAPRCSSFNPQSAMRKVAVHLPSTGNARQVAGSAAPARWPHGA